MVKLTKEDENKLGQILKELNEMRNVLKGGEGSGVKGHLTHEPTQEQREASEKWEKDQKEKVKHHVTNLWGQAHRRASYKKKRKY